MRIITVDTHMSYKLVLEVSDCDVKSPLFDC